MKTKLNIIITGVTGHEIKQPLCPSLRLKANTLPPAVKTVIYQQDFAA
jgi:hypothetical protein